MRIEILCTGDEILSGKTINTNYGHMARRLFEEDLGVVWGTTVGDDRDALRAAFRQAAERADVVIVNGGLGPTVDDLSQEIAAEVAGVPLVLHGPWLERMEGFYARRNRVMPPNNRKQAMLPDGAEFIDNPIGTACGFAVTIAGARFYFTPGVPREMLRMLDEQIIPRLLAKAGRAGVMRLKRFHSFGIGESRADQMLAGLEERAPPGAVKLGFQAHYPQLETKLSVRAADAAALEAILMPLEAAVRQRLGNFIVAEDAQSLEGVVIGALGEGTLAVAETLTGGAIAQRLLQVPGAEARFRRGLVLPPAGSDTGAVARAAALRAESGATHALAVLVTLADDATEGGRIEIGLVDPAGDVTREARLVGNREWVRLGAAELGLDVLRRRLLGLPVDDMVDFERR